MRYEIDEEGVLLGCFGEDKIVYIPDGIKEIGAAAFEEEEEAYGQILCKANETMEEVVIPASVETIGVGAFRYCNALRRIRFLGEGLRKIEIVAVTSCPALEEIEIPEGVEEIGANAFANNPSLKRAILPRSLKRLGPVIFSSSPIEKIYYRGTEEEFAAVERLYAVDETKLVFSCTSRLCELPD